MTVEEQDLRDTARALGWLFQLLEDAKHAPTPPPRDGRPMQQTFGPRDPTRVWLLSAEDELLEERKTVDEYGHPLPEEEIIPGGLRAIAVDAAQHIGEPVRHPEEEEKLKGMKLRAWEMCDFVARRAQQISLDFPEVDGLLELMVEQARWISHRLDPKHNEPDPDDPFLTMKSVQRSLASRGVSCPEGTIRRWASEGTVAVGRDEGGGRAYRLRDILDQVARREAA